MEKSSKFRFELVGSQELAAELKTIERESHGELTILSCSKKDKDAARLGLDFTQIYHIVIAMGDGFATLNLSLELWKYLSRSRHEIIIETDERMFKLKPSATREEIEKIIEELMKPDSK